MEPPVCDRCIESPDSIEKLEQHASVLREPGGFSEEKTTDGHQQGAPELRPPTSRRNTMQKGLQKQQALKPQDCPPNEERPRPLPRWMSLLPSNVNPHVKPPANTILSRRMTFPSCYSSNKSTPYMTPLEWPIAHDNYISNDHGIPARLSLNGDMTPKAAPTHARYSSLDLTSSLSDAEARYSVHSDEFLTEPQPYLKNFPSIKKPPSNEFASPGDFTMTTDAPCKVPSMYGEADLLYGYDPRNFSSETSINSIETVYGPTTTFLPRKDSAETFSSTKLFYPYRSDSRASVSEACIPALYTPAAFSTKRSLSPEFPHSSDTDYRVRKLRKALKQQSADANVSPHSRTRSPTAPNQPPFLKELSSFFASRKGSSGTRLILPSRAMERKVPGKVRIGLRSTSGSKMRKQDSYVECDIPSACADETCAETDIRGYDVTGWDGEKSQWRIKFAG